jgi:ABC-2 type transport system ATP-binding protein
VRMLTSILTPTRGRALVNGYDVVTQADQVRASVGVLTEQHGLYTRMTALEYMEFFWEIYRLDKPALARRNAQLLDYFGLTEAAKRRIGEYSKGMRQKLALARALIHEPPVLLLDEPTSAMDPESARLVRDEILRLRSSQRTIIICTHNLMEAEALADEIAIIYRGRILLKGTIPELKASLLGPPEYEVTLASDWTESSLPLPEGVDLLERSNRSLRFRVQQPLESNPKLVQALTSRAAPVVSVQEVPRNLEQVYLQVMARAQEVQHA